MTMSAVRWMLLGAVGFAAASLMSSASAKDELPKAVRSVLADESRLSRYDVNRRQRLGAELVNAKNSDGALHWHAGFVKVNGKWLPFEESISLQPIRGNEREYLERRARTEQSPKSQADLAKWCGQHGLSEQSHAHYYRAMMLSPADADIRDMYRRMGYVRASTCWLSPYDLNEAKSDARLYAMRLERCAMDCQRFGEALESGRLDESTRHKRLSVLMEEEKVPALEAVLASRSEASALAAIEAIEQVPTYHATEALGRIAVLSPWLFARDRAIEGLKSRKKAEYIPQWMSLARVPVRTEFHRIASGWNLAFVFLLAEEGESEIRITKNTVVALGAATPAFLAGIQNPNAFAPQRQAYWARLNTTLKALDEQMKVAQDFSNEQIDFVNERVAFALKETVGKSVGDTPQEWWNWWTRESGFEPPSQKKVVIISENETETPQAPQRSCLGAGTPIWTERGLIAVERIQAGDRVLSKNIETGELAYKVVLHTTVREPFPVKKFVMGDETIQATEGHHFWVSGKGWTKTRELAAEQPLHTPIGTVRVASTEPAEAAPTYNLVVADFHTYFVGKSGILSHDVLPPKPTNKVVPGLSE